MTTDTATETLEAVVSDVPNPSDDQVLATIPTAELEKISATDQQLAKLLEEAQRIAALGVPQTQAEADLVHKFTMVTVKVRTDADKLADQLAAPFKAQYDAIKGEGKRIGDKAREAEALTRPLKAVWDEADKERKRQIAEARAAEERAKAARTLERAQALHGIGAVSLPGVYVYGEIRIEAIELTDLPESEWTELFGRVEAAAAEQKRKDDAEAERLRVIAQQQEEQRKAEQKRQQDEADRIKAEQEKRQRELNEEAERLTQLRIDARTERLVSMGATLLVTGEITWNRQTIMFKQALGVASSEDFEKIVADFAQRKAQHEMEITQMANREARLLAQGWEREGPFYFYNNRPDLTVVEIGNATEEEFERWIAEFEQWKSDEIQAEQLTKIRTERILETGATLDPGGCLMWQGCIVARQPELGAMSDDEFEAHLSTVVQFQKDKVDAAKQAEADEKARKKADRERTQRLAPDKKRLGKWLKAFDFSLPEMQEIEAIDLMGDFVADVGEVLKRYIAKIDAL